MGRKKVFTETSCVETMKKHLDVLGNHSLLQTQFALSMMKSLEPKFARKVMEHRQQPKTTFGYGAHGANEQLGLDQKCLDNSYDSVPETAAIA